MNKKLQKEMINQINKEFFSAYLYLAMAAYFEDRGLAGFARWMQLQAKEELEHGMKIFGFLADRGVKVTLDAIAKPTSDFSSIKDVFGKTLAHEKKVTASIDNLYGIAQSVKDNASVMFLAWFITEQVEEEKNASDILAKLEYVKKEDSAGILMLDKALGMRAGS